MFNIYQIISMIHLSMNYCTLMEHMSMEPTRRKTNKIKWFGIMANFTNIFSLFMEFT